VFQADEDEAQLLGDFRLRREVLGQRLSRRVDDVRQGGEHALDDQVGHDAEVGSVQVLQFGHQGQVGGEVRAILLTRALDGWDDLDSLLQRWSSLGATQQSAILKCCGQLARYLHGVRQVHGCFYPKHIFLRAEGAGYQAQLIDLEKTRPLLFGVRDRVKDLEPLLRRAPQWSEVQLRELLAAYLDQPSDSSLVDSWIARLTARRSHKETR